MKTRDEQYNNALRAIDTVMSYGSPYDALNTLDELMAEIRVRIEALRDDMQDEYEDKTHDR